MLIRVTAYGRKTVVQPFELTDFALVSCFITVGNTFLFNTAQKVYGMHADVNKHVRSKHNNQYQFKNEVGIHQ